MLLKSAVGAAEDLERVKDCRAGCIRVESPAKQHQNMGKFLPYDEVQHSDRHPM